MSVSDLPIPILIIVVIIVLYLISSIKILRDYERAVIFRLGRALPTPKGPASSWSSGRWIRWCAFRCGRRCWKFRRRT